MFGMNVTQTLTVYGLTTLTLVESRVPRFDFLCCVHGQYFMLFQVQSSSSCRDSADILLVENWFVYRVNASMRTVLGKGRGRVVDF